MLRRIARAWASAISVTFTGRTLEEAEAEQNRVLQLAEVNRLIELRLAQHRYLFRNREEMIAAINMALNTPANPALRQLLRKDPYLSRLLRLNKAVAKSLKSPL